MDKKNLRSRLYLLVLMIAIFAVWKYRQDKGLATVYVKGITMGVVQYNITYRDQQGRDFKPAIDSLLIDFNQSLSTYIPDSEISVFNRESVVEFELPYFPDVLEASAEVYEKSGGAFDPTIGQLIDAWGFGSGDAIDPDSVQVDSLLELVGFDKIQFNNQRVITPIDGIALNFSAIAKGQAIDVVAEFLELPLVWPNPDPVSQYRGEDGRPRTSEEQPHIHRPPRRGASAGEPARSSRTFTG